MRSRYGVILLAVLLLGQSAVFLEARLMAPSDGTRHVPMENRTPAGEDGLAVSTLVNYPGGLQNGDVVVAVEGISLEHWLMNRIDNAIESPDLQIGDTVAYTIRRGQETLVIEQPLAPYPLRAELARSWPIHSVNILFLVLSLFLFVKRPDEPAAQILFLVAIAGVATNWDWGLQVTDFVSGTGLAHYILSTTIVFVLFWTAFLHFALSFPNPGHWLADRPWIVPLLYLSPYLLIGIGWLIVRQTQASAMGWFSNYLLPVLVLVVVLALTTLVVVVFRLRAVTDPVERAQIRWVLFAAVVAFTIGSAVGLMPQLLTGEFLLGVEIGYPIVLAAFLLVPLAVVISVLRYHLFDIDVIIRRTTSYAILTGMLAVVYLGSIIILQRVLSPITGESDIAIVLSTLLIAALFLPLRRRVQDVIDRRFFRSKYDAEQVLEQFAATVRDETDLDALTAELVRVIQETMQPEFVNVWLRPVVAQASSAGVPAGSEEELSNT